MQVKPIRTAIIIPGQDLYEILDQSIKKMPEKSVLAITSKVIAILEGMVVAGNIDKEKLIKKEADYYLASDNRYGHLLTIKNNILIPSAGVDESNANGKFILWPKDPQKSANKIRAYLKKRFGLKDIGVVITDSRTTPLRWGTSGVAIACTGFLATNDYIGKPDLFGRPLKVTKANIADGLAAAAVLVMGEGSEQTPMAQITDIPFVKFTKKESVDLTIPLEDDLYSALLKSVKWRKC